MNRMHGLSHFRETVFVRIVIAVVMLLVAGAAAAQDDSLAGELVRKHVRINSAKMTMSGYRVQIYYGSQRTRASEVKSEFMARHPGIPSYLLYQQPNFKVRVGNFKTRLEALNRLDRIQSDYPAAFVVPDEVPLPRLEMEKE